MNGEEGAIVKEPMPLVTSGTTFLFGLKSSELFLLTYLSLLIGAIHAAFFPEHGFWQVTGISFFLFNLGHMVFTASRYIILPGLMSFIASINLIIAPMLAYSYRASVKTYHMAVPPERYFCFAVPAVIALWLGAHLTFTSGMDYRAANRNDSELFPRERRLADALIVFGILLTHFSDYLPLGLSFFFYIISQLRFVAALSLMFTNTKGWEKRIVLVYAHLFMFVARGGVFYEFILWAFYLLICRAFLKKWRWKLVLSMTGAFLSIMLLNEIKGDYRLFISGQETGSMEKGLLIGDLMWKAVSTPNETINNKNNGDRLVRYNQGWIVATIMKRVPENVPFADGETIVDAVKASILPRFLAPDKTGAASKELFYRFTGHRLRNNTSMALGVVGEMYANFGDVGGVIGVFVYGLLIGMIFSWIAKRAEQNVLWWAWLPFVMFSVIEAEWNIADILNNVTKSLMVMLAIIFTFRRYNIRLFQLH